MRLRDERGSAFVLALAFLGLFGLMIPLVLRYASTNMLVTERLRDQRAAIYAGGSGIDGAVQFVRSNPTYGTFGGPCPSFNVTVNGLSATVACQSETQGIDLDRTVKFTASVQGEQVTAKVLFHDVSTPVGSVDVLSWSVSP